MKPRFHQFQDRWLRVAAPIALLAIIAVLALLFAQDTPFMAQDRTVNGLVVDAVTQQPLGGAVVRLGNTVIETDENGHYVIDQVKSNVTLIIEANGYRHSRIKVGSGGTLTAKLDPLVLAGVLKDAETGQPLVGAEVSVGDVTATTDNQGRYRVEKIRSVGPVQVRAPGYVARQLEYSGQEELNASLNPNSMAIKVFDEATNAPLSARITVGNVNVQTDANGRATLSRLVEGSQINIEAAGYGSVIIAYTGQPQIEVSLNQNTLVGRVLDAVTNTPLAGALVADGKNFTTTAADGSYKLENLAQGELLKVRAHGYAPMSVDLSQGRPTELKLRPNNVRALYLTYYGVGDEGILQHALQVIDETEANALVIDIKGDRGWIVYESKVPMVQTIGAQQDIQIKDIKALLDVLKQREIYTIARIVTFKDDPLARARPDLAVHDGRNGGLWIDGEGLAWTDPFKEEVWDYNIALAVEAANLGFDEIQFDYVRFPTDPSAGTTVDATVFSRENLMANRVEAISAFLKKADEALKPTGTALAADIFGYVTWRTDDMGIGQHLETLGSLVDYICPMVYPTLYWDGIPRMDGGDPFETDAPAHPYEIVHLSLKEAESRLQGARAKLRPWLQYYNDYILDIPYGAHEIELQKQATYDTNLDGWMMWDPSNQYTKGGFAPKQ